MSQLFSIIQIVISVLLIICVLVQQRGSGLSGLFGGGGETYHTKRGMEKIIFTATIVLVVLFLCLGVVRLILAA
jgi:preprotein translocase subunit SecG